MGRAGRRGLAAIAAVHDEASTATATARPEIVGPYHLQVQI
jgi:hypothetical protein